MQDSYSELIKLLLLKLLLNTLNLLPIKKGDELLHLYLKEINSIPKEYRQSKLSSKGSLMR
jgi:hypothetical protein